MSLGVLNNLSAVYAENYLNQTNNSLNTVLEQLSSGSKINSGADDAAGLSLVDGLQANQQALSQSETNATEGVGLLQVADGALSQVTSLLNRAVTLATEASNGTLNSTQDTAADQEYQSILSEISNIGSTTTYNQEQVFGSNTNIYTGDSSLAGSSVDALDVRSLSSSNVGDTGGVMSYSNGQSSVFLNLSTATQNAQSTDTLNGNGSSTINVNYLVKGADGQSAPASTSITVGTGTSYANTANGLISAINNAGLGLTANFVTQTQAGVAGGGTETGIQIAGGLISVGVAPSASVTSGTLNPSEITNSQLTVGQTIAVNVGSTNAATVTIGQTNDTLAGLAAAINAGTGGSGGVTATVVYNGSGEATSMKLADSSNAGGALTVTTTPANVVPNALTPGTQITSASNPTTVTFAAGATGASGVQGTASLSVTGAGSDNPTQALTGSITLSNGSNTQTYIMGTGGSDSVSGNQITLSAAHSTLQGLANAITGNLGATATASSSGIAITSTAPGTSITEGSSTLAAVLSVGAVSTNVAGVAATTGTDASTSLSMVGDNKGFVSGDADNLTGGFDITVGGVTTDITMGSGSAWAAGTPNTLTTSATNADALITAIGAHTGAIGVTAAISNGQIVFTSNAVNSPITISSNTLAGASSTMVAANSGVAPAVANFQTVSVTNGIGAPGTGLGALTQTGDALTGSITINDTGGTAITYTMSAAGSNSWNAGGNTLTLSAANSTVSGLMAAINGTGGHGVSNVTASLTQAAGAATSGLKLTDGLGATGNIQVTGNTLANQASMTFTTPASGGNSQFQSGVMSLEDGGVLASGGGAADGTLGGSVTVTSVVNGHSVTDTFNMGGSTSSDTATNFYTGGTTLQSLINAINTAGGPSGNLDLTASQDVASGGIFLQSSASSDTGLAMNTSALTESLAYSTGSQSTITYTPTTVTLTGAGTGDVLSRNDVLTSATALQLTNSAANSGNPVTFTVGGNAGTTLGSLIDAINNSALSLHAAINSGVLDLTSTVTGGAGTITVGTNTITEAYTSNAATVSLGTGATSATSATATLNTTAGMTAAGSDALGGQLTLQYNAGPTVTFNLNNNTASTGNTVNLTAANSTLTGLVTAINQATAAGGLGLGVTASINATTGALQLQSTAAGAHSIVIGGTGLTDASGNSLVNYAAGVTGIAAKQSTATINLVGVGNNFNATDKLSGSISVTANGSTMNYVMGTGASNSSSGNTITLSAANSTVGGFENALLNYSGVTAAANNGAMTLTSNTANSDAISVSNNSLEDSLGYAAATASLGTFASQSDQVSGQLNFSVDGNNYALGSVSGMTVAQMINKINYGNVAGTGTSGVNGVTAAWVPTGAGSFGTVQLTSNTFGASGNITNYGSGTSINDLGTSASLSYTAGSAYNVGISNVATSGVYDSATQAGAPAGPSAAFANLTASGSGSSGIATISYSDGAGASLSATDLLSQADAQTALTNLNSAIADVAAQDGYIGAQINTLNSVSDVLSTQAENVQSAQNAVQATDYATATSNMAKYEILSQTGIAALAQANSQQQEVLKLLQ